MNALPRKDLAALANDLKPKRNYLVDKIPTVNTPEFYRLHWMENDFEVEDPILSPGADPQAIRGSSRHPIIGSTSERGLGVYIPRADMARLKQQTQNSTDGTDYVKYEEAQKVRDVKERILRGKEKAFVEAVTDIAENESRSYEVTTVWDGVSPDPLQDIIDAAKEFADTRGVEPNVLFMNKYLADYLKLNLSSDGTLELAEKIIQEGVQNSLNTIFGFELWYTDARYNSAKKQDSRTLKYFLDKNYAYLAYMEKSPSLTTAEATFAMNAVTEYPNGKAGWWVRHIPETERGGHNYYEVYHWSNTQIIDNRCLMRINGAANAELVTLS